MTDEPKTEELQPEVGTQIVRAAGEWLHPLEPYGPSRALRELTRRIMLFDTGQVKMTAPEASHLAQVSASAWLNPFTGEIWAWVDTYKGERRLNLMPGRKGLIRHAKEQAREDGDHFWPEYEKVVSPALRAEYLIGEGDLVYVCKLRSVKEIDAWNRSVEAAAAAGFGPAEVKEQVGPRPFTFGLGVLRRQEMKRLDESGKVAMTHVERCQKRAYMMALKQKFHLPLAHAIGQAGETVDDYVLDVEFRELPSSQEAELLGQAGKLADSSGGKAEGQATETETESEQNPRPYSPEEVRKRLRKAVGRFGGTRKTDKIGKLEMWQMVGWQLGQCFAGSDDQDAKRHSVLAYLLNKKSSKDLNGAECRAILRWLEPDEREGPGAGITPAPEAIREAHLILEARLLELGQERMKELEHGKD